MVIGVADACLDKSAKEKEAMWNSLVTRRLLMPNGLGGFG